MRAQMDARSRLITLVLALLAASGFTLAVQSPWWTVAEVHVGPFGSRHCFGGECREAGLAWLTEGRGELWMRSAIASRAAGFIAAFALLMLAAGLAAKRVPTLIARGSAAAILTAAATGGYFLAAFPGIPGATVARGVYMFLAAVLFGVATIVMFIRSTRPAS
jgi:hypothetical protein